MTTKHEAFPELKSAIARHFPKITDDCLEELAASIWDGSITADALQWIERSDLKPSDDIENLKKAADKIRSAAEDLGKLGWNGSHAVHLLGLQNYQKENSLPGLPAMGSRDALEVLVSSLERLRSEFTDAANSIDPEAPSVSTAFDLDKPSGRGRGQPRKTQAEIVALECYDAFRSATGQTPTRTPSGPFVAFVRDVFSALEINGNPENYSRRACEVRNRELP